ncbi:MULTISPECIES: polysaccharide pyruvyl transferase family protein [Methanobacterium]|jgi:polysaccharide pyruvyl transferase WcaK-like protein|uniref:Polysaccharide pyruvyl transferase family protein n=1 Tax=Methanobacterium veterum TaxID=408577 RepID=A0A9E4ZZG9_9EURY|nr:MULTISPECIES: polysaccharide pyruvyl transferase family protein [Methanobacterium]MCZ3366069.1 polysaccharide pyruvyl transferase family protein [Methanobacterium veterum]MCZ3371703.1 polysaccharide pyruvyl transferase family protein [Methanobacterium veterum]
MKKNLKVLLLGYNGANNTGSEARLLAIIEDIRVILGNKALITVPTLNKENLERYLKEDKFLKVAPISSIFFFDIRKLVKEHDVLLLIEGSCYMDTWTSALLWAFLWATKCAKDFKKPSIAYAVDVGHLSSFNRWLVKREASKTDLILTRTESAAHELQKIGVKAPIRTTADCAFTFKTEKEDDEILKEIWPELDSGVVGLAPIDFYLWPVVMRPWGKKENLYKWPYYYSRSKSRVDGSEQLALKWAEEADRIIEKYGKRVALICMEELDEPLAVCIKNKMKKPEMVKIFSSRKYNASTMTNILRSLELLVTSRYHAGVLSLEAQVPQIAIGHDTRLRGFYKELGLENYLLDYMSSEIWYKLKEKVNELLENPKTQQGLLKDGFIQHIGRAHKNPEILKGFLQERGWKVKT